MFIAIVAFAIGSQSVGPAQPWPENCSEGSACDPRYAERFADPDDHEGVFALTNMSEVFAADHYPIEALREAKQGRVRVKVEVSAEGKPVKCSVIQSSRVASLNKATCDRLIDAGRFKIAHEGAGQAKSYLTTMSISWTLPAFELFRERRMKTVVPIDQAGTMGPCRVEIIIQGSTASPPCPEQLLAQARKIVASAPMVEAISNRELVLEEGLLIGESSQLATIGRGPGDQLLLSTGLAIKVDANGKVQACDKIADGPADPFESDMCRLQLKHRYSPLAKRDPNRLPRDGLYYFAIYLREPPANATGNSR